VSINAGTTTPHSTQQTTVGTLAGKTSAKSSTPAGTHGSGLSAFLSLLNSQEPAVDMALPGAIQVETDELSVEGDSTTALATSAQDDLAFFLIQGGHWQPDAPEIPPKEDPADCAASIFIGGLSSGASQRPMSDDVARFTAADAVQASSTGKVKTHGKPGVDSRQLESLNAAALIVDSASSLQGRANSSFDSSVDTTALRMTSLIAGKGILAQSEGAIPPAISALTESKSTDRSQARDVFKNFGAGLDNGWGMGGLPAGALTYSTSAETSLITPEAVAEQVTYWVNQELQNAELTLDGAGHEPIEVSISLQGNEAHVAFRSDQASTREMLEGAMSHLKDMLANHGLSLSGVSVGSSGTGDQNPKEHKNAHHGRKTTVQVPSQEGSVTANRTSAYGARVIDLFV
jgi:Flagellar hook-length control protein FliK